jgi:pentatricopeptide repeat protein
MEELGVILRDSSDYAQALQPCINRKGLAEERATQIIKRFGLDIFLQNYLVNFYAKCGSLFDACQVFEKMSERNVISWNASIAEHVQHGYATEALKLFCKMHLANMKANEFALGSALRACTSVADIEKGKCIHAGTLKNGFEYGVVLGSALIDMYTKSGILEVSRQMFVEMPDWNSVSWWCRQNTVKLFLYTVKTESWKQI